MRRAPSDAIGIGIGDNHHVLSDSDIIWIDNPVSVAIREPDFDRLEWFSVLKMSN
jgi:hypothetical protein